MLGTDHFTNLHWGRARSITALVLIHVVFGLLLYFPTSRGYALVGLALMASVMLHEAGHFIAAKWAGMKATEFFVGFGPRIWSFTKGETEYGLKAIPLGGYVKIIGMTSAEEVDKEDEGRTYREGKTHKKLIVILAGVTVNLILAYLLIFSVLVFKGVAVDRADNRAVIETVNPNSPAAKAGIKPNDEIIAIDGERVESFDALAENIRAKNVGDEVEITYLRDGEEINARAELISAVNEKGESIDQPIIGVTPVFLYERVNPIEATTMTFDAMGNVVESSVNVIMNRFSASGLREYSQIVVEGDYERQDRPSSIAGIVDSGGFMVNQDIWVLLQLIGVVNIFLALLNLIPLLPLDGGHAAIAAFEGVASKVKKRKVTVDINKLMPITIAFVGFMLLITLGTLWLDLLQITS